MDSKTANNGANGHCQPGCAVESHYHPSFTIQSDFPRAASRSLLEEQNSDEDNNKIDFSVEQEILKKQRKKEAEKKAEKEAENKDQLKPGELPHKSSNASMLDECEDNEDEIVKALEEIDEEK